MESETEGKEFRWFQVAIDVTWGFNMDVKPPSEIRPIRIWERCLVTPDIGTYLCEGTPSTYFDVLDYSAEFDGEVDDDVRDAWDNWLMDAEASPYYMGYRQVWNSDGTPTERLGRWAAQPEDTEANAREYAQGNHLV